MEKLSFFFKYMKYHMNIKLNRFDVNFARIARTSESINNKKKEVQPDKKGESGLGCNFQTIQRKLVSTV